MSSYGMLLGDLMWDGGGEGEGRKCTECPIKTSAVRI